MTKKELAAIKEVTKEYDKYDKCKDSSFEKLQAMAKEIGAPVYCCALSNLESIIFHANAGYDMKKRAIDLYASYVASGCQKDIILDLGHNLANATGHDWTL